VICKGPFQTPLEADNATPEDGKNTTLLPVFSPLPKVLQEFILSNKYNAIFNRKYKITCKNVTEEF
jgi:hypothetical protein